MADEKIYQIYCNGQLFEVSKELHDYYTKSERKLTYAEKDRKQERIRRNRMTGKEEILPSMEDSLERLIEKDVQFAAEQEDVIDIAVQKLLVEYLLSKLTADEKELIVQIYFLGFTEREIAKIKGINHNAIHKKKLSILAKLHKLLEK